MSTYAPSPHIYAEIPGPGTSDSDINQVLDSLYFFMQAAGWEVAWVNPIVSITTTTGLFPFCNAALAQASNYQVGGKPILMFEQDRIICIDEGGCCSCPVPPADPDPDFCRNILEADGWTNFQFVSQPLALSDTHTTAKAAFSAAMNLQGYGASAISTELVGSQDVTWPTGGSSATTHFLVTDPDNLYLRIGAGVPTIAFGNSTSTTASPPAWYGFIARCQDSSVEDNSFELFFTVAPGGTLIRVYARKTWNFVPLPNIPTTHPALILATEDATGTGEFYGTGSSPLNHIRRTRIYTGSTIKAFSNAHQVFLRQVGVPVFTLFHTAAGALKLRALEGENPLTTSVWNLQEAWYLLGGDSSNPTSLFTDSSVQGGADSTYTRIGGPGMPGGYRETSGGIKNLPLASWTTADGSNTDINAVGGFWRGGIAMIMEPWAGFCPIDSAGDRDIVPSFGQLWDCITPWRQISASEHSIFRWDGQWWRYIQLTKDISNAPPCATALRIDGPEVFTGFAIPTCVNGEIEQQHRGFEGPIFAEIASILVSGSAPGTLTITVTLAANAPAATLVLVPCGDDIFSYTEPAHDVLVHVESDSARITYPSGNLITIPSGSNSGMLDVTATDIDYAQSVLLTVRSENAVQTTINLGT